MCEQCHTVVIVEDDPVISKFFRMAIDSSPQLTVVGCAGSLQEGKPLLTQKQPDVLLVDLGLPDGSGIKLLHHARAMKANIECMVITTYDDNEHLFRALRAGASSYLLKDALPINIAQSIIKMLAGEAPISPAIARSLLGSFCKQTTEQQPDMDLTTREIEVLELMAKGQPRKEIAQRLAISHHTINSHVRNIYRKLEVNSNTEAIHKAQQMDVIP